MRGVNRNARILESSPDKRCNTHERILALKYETLTAYPTKGRLRRRHRPLSPTRLIPKSLINNNDTRGDFVDEIEEDRTQYANDKMKRIDMQSAKYTSRRNQSLSNNKIKKLPVEKAIPMIITNKSELSDSVSAIRAVFEADNDNIANRIFPVDYEKQIRKELNEKKSRNVTETKYKTKHKREILSEQRNGSENIPNSTVLLTQTRREPTLYSTKPHKPYELPTKKVMNAYGSNLKNRKSSSIKSIESTMPEKKSALDLKEIYKSGSHENEREFQELGSQSLSFSDHLLDHVSGQSGMDITNIDDAIDKWISSLIPSKTLSFGKEKCSNEIEKKKRTVKWKNDDELEKIREYEEENMFAYATEKLFSEQMIDEVSPSCRMSTICHTMDIFSFLDNENNDLDLSDDNSLEDIDSSTDDEDPDFVVVQTSMRGKWGKIY